jgi:hypothetical protein
MKWIDELNARSDMSAELLEVMNKRLNDEIN